MIHRARGRALAAGLATAVGALASSAAASPVVFAPSRDVESGGRPRLHLEVPLFEAPFDVFAKGSYPSMAQATWVTADLYELAHFGLHRLRDPFSADPGEKAVGIFLTSAFDTAYFLVATPLGPHWSHEEWHRAVLTRSRVPADNPLATSFGVPLFDPIPVKIDGASEASFKAARPADYAHVSIAGFASHYALVQALERNAFFRDQPTLSSFAIGMNVLLPPVYHTLCLGDGVVGGDCSVWVKQLHAPTEAPVERALTAPERGTMSLALGLSLVNLLDPFIVGIRAFEAPLGARPLRWNAAVRAVPTPFGHDVRLDGFFKRGTSGLAVSLHHAFNDKSYFPGLDAEWLGAPSRDVELSVRAGGWLQPKDQSFGTGSAQPGGKVGARAAAHLLEARLSPFLDVEAKSQGWVMGNAFLEANVTATAGASLDLF